MREILFRGKRLDAQPPYKIGMNDDSHDGWVYGYYVHKGNSNCLGESDEKHYIYVWRHYDWNLDNIEKIEVDPSTVGQFTGLCDKNRKKIFEGDMFAPPDDEIDKAVVEFAYGSFRVVLYGTIGAMMESGWDETAGGYGTVEAEPIEFYGVKELEVIGTIYDKEGV